MDQPSKRNWITCREAAAINGVTARRIRARVQAGHYRHVWQPNPRLLLLDRDEVKRLGNNPNGRPAKS